MAWTVKFSNKAAKQARKLPGNVSGPVRGNWKSYGKLEGRKNQHHCHIKTGKPTYVVVWEESTTEIKIVEVKYAGTHENAPY